MTAWFNLIQRDGEMLFKNYRQNLKWFTKTHFHCLVLANIPASRHYILFDGRCFNDIK